MFNDSKPLATLGDREEQRKVGEEESEDISSADSSAYRMLTARLSCFAMDRPGLRFATKGVAKYLSKPNVHHWLLLKRVGRYLLHAPRLIQRFEWTRGVGCVNGYSDSDWAG